MIKDEQTFTTADRLTESSTPPAAHFGDDRERLRQELQSDNDPWDALDLFNLAPSLNPLLWLPTLRWHHAACSGKWDVETFLKTHRSRLIHSELDEEYEEEAASPKFSWTSLIFQLEDGLFAGLNSFCPPNSFVLHVWADTKDRAEATLLDFRDKYRLRKARGEQPRFNIISVSKEDGVQRRSCEITEAFACSPEELALHYGSNFPGWLEDFLQRLKKRASGVSLFQGEPGTGKTSFLRYLIGRLRDTHRFYYFPVEHFEMFSSPQMVAFWISENARAKGRNLEKIVIIEDAEALVARREPDNQQNVSNLLNISDGLLGEFLRVHLICTLNCRVTDVDPAITRPGRLVSFHTFKRLTLSEANALANTRGLPILSQRKDYSLAEIYNMNSELSEGSPSPSEIGFRPAEQHE